MALILSLSLFACGSSDEELVLNPVEGEIEQNVSGNKVYDTLTGRITPVYTYDSEKSGESWNEQVKERFIKLLGIDKIAKNAEGCALNVKITETKECDGYTRYHIVFNSEYGATVPCYLLIPTTGQAKYPLAITLHGHSNYGYHYAAGNAEAYMDKVGDLTETEDALYALPDPDTITDPAEKQNVLNKKKELEAKIATIKEVLEYAARADYAVQAVERGFAALAIEQRGMSDRTASSTPEGASMCEFAAQQELIRGRTLIGGRVWDVSKAIDALSDSALSAISSKIDLTDITITGSSGGGTASYYAGCYDERIGTVAPNCGFSSYEESIMSVYHCSCNFIPGIYEYFDMQDLACLIAPRKLAIIYGVKDDVFPMQGVEKGYETIAKIFKDAGVENNCSLTGSARGHYWDENDVWTAIEDIRNVK